MTFVDEVRASGPPSLRRKDKGTPTDLRDLEAVIRTTEKPVREAGVPTVSVVIPTLNEAKNLAHVFSRMPADIHEVIIVDGLSTDGTPAMAVSLRDDVRIVMVTQRGKGAALTAGTAAATGDIVVLMDADGSTDPAEIPKFVAALVAGADFAKGTRCVPGGGSTDFTVGRKVGNWILSNIANAMYGTAYTDINYGYNAFWKSLTERVDFTCDGFEVEALMSVRVAKAKVKVAEVPSFEFPRIHGISKLSVHRDGLRVLSTIFKERFK